MTTGLDMLERDGYREMIINSLLACDQLAAGESLTDRMETWWVKCDCLVSIAKLWAESQELEQAERIANKMRDSLEDVEGANLALKKIVVEGADRALKGIVEALTDAEEFLQANEIAEKIETPHIKADTIFALNGRVKLKLND